MATIIDRGESVSEMSPMRISMSDFEFRDLLDLAMSVAMRSTGFRKSLPSSFVSALAKLVRSMNCYYSNLIEGHSTHPIDIERALKNDYSSDPKKRSLQLEAKAHIKVQSWIDSGGLKEKIATVDGILEIHRRFCEELPEELLVCVSTTTNKQERVYPGVIREHDVQVGKHVPISPGAVPRFLQHFQDVYSTFGTTDLILNCAASHHRLLWIHPFLDGNGRVARLLSHAWFVETLDTGALWSISRGLARSVPDYKEHLSNCDLPRRNDLDGRGPLSEESLFSFTRFFLKVCLDQIRFMEELMEPQILKTRITLWAEEQMRLGNLAERSIRLLEMLLYRGEVERKEVPDIVGVGDRQARRIVAELSTFGVISSESTRSSLRLEFPAALAERFMPGLFPEK